MKRYTMLLNYTPTYVIVTTLSMEITVDVQVSSHITAIEFRHNDR